jgi:hypothetical protein
MTVILVQAIQRMHIIPIICSDYNRTSCGAYAFSIKKEGLRWIKASRTQVGFAHKDKHVRESIIRASIKDICVCIIKI